MAAAVPCIPLNMGNVEVKRSTVESQARADEHDLCNMGYMKVIEHDKFQTTAGDKTPRPYMLTVHPHRRHTRHAVWWPPALHPTEQLKERHTTIAHHAPKGHLKPEIEGHTPTYSRAHSSCGGGMMAQEGIWFKIPAISLNAGSSQQEEGG